MNIHIFYYDFNKDSEGLAPGDAYYPKVASIIRKKLKEKKGIKKIYNHPLSILIEPNNNIPNYSYRENANHGIEKFIDNYNLEKDDKHVTFFIFVGELFGIHCFLNDNKLVYGSNGYKVIFLLSKYGRIIPDPYLLEEIESKRYIKLDELREMMIPGTYRFPDDYEIIRGLPKGDYIVKYGYSQSAEGVHDFEEVNGEQIIKELEDNSGDCLKIYAQVQPLRKDIYGKCHELKFHLVNGEVKSMVPFSYGGRAPYSKYQKEFTYDKNILDFVNRVNNIFKRYYGPQPALRIDVIIECENKGNDLELLQNLNEKKIYFNEIEQGLTSATLPSLFNWIDEKGKSTSVPPNDNRYFDKFMGLFVDELYEIMNKQKGESILQKRYARYRTKYENAL